MSGRDNAPRASLTPVFRKGAWYARGSVPVREGDRIAKRRIERSTGATSRKAAKLVCDQLNQMFEERALSSRRTLTFAKALTNYVTATGHAPKFAEKLLDHFGEMLVSEIDNTAMLEARAALFAPDAKAPYVNRHLYTPVIAILRLASKDGACGRPDFTRPKGYAKHPPVESPQDDSWYAKVLNYMSASGRALACFLTVHGRRVGEAVKCKPKDFNPARGTLALGRTKNGEEVIVNLHPTVVDLMLDMQDWREREFLFGYRPSKNGGCDAFNNEVRAACARAGVPYYSAHKLGRHRFALRMLDEGHSLQTVKDSGGWKTIAVLSDRYGARAMSEMTRFVHDTGEKALVVIRGADAGEPITINVEKANVISENEGD